MEKEKRQRLTIWGVFLIMIGLVASLILPEHSLEYFFGLLKDIIAHLLI